MDLIGLVDRIVALEDVQPPALRRHVRIGRLVPLEHDAVATIRLAGEQPARLIVCRGRWRRGGDGGRRRRRRRSRRALRAAARCTLCQLARRASLVALIAFPLLSARKSAFLHRAQLTGSVPAQCSVTDCAWPCGPCPTSGRAWPPLARRAFYPWRCASRAAASLPAARRMPTLARWRPTARRLQLGRRRRCARCPLPPARPCAPPRRLRRFPRR
mmetsp:Transcript_21374/g.66319  ORF Transcript_21374/g.66319 Transcript_21374/m.66319 type:complete len:215 (-) Transcript_21374:227-871(-)